MDFKDAIKQLSERVIKQKELVHTEEATKHAFVMPFLQALGYDVFNPLEVVPEFIADIGIKKGEKVDYAIMKEEKPIILIECKHWSADLDPHSSQLFRYFHTTKAKFAILTNGLESKFYTDLDEKNKMDEKPFFIFDLNDARDNQIEELKKFHKNYFDTDTIVSTASELKYLSQLKSLLNTEFNNPSQDFVKHFAKQIYTAGIITQKILDQFIELTKKSVQLYINDLITDRLKLALQKEEADQKNLVPIENLMEAEEKITITQEEIDSFNIVKSILRRHVPLSKINYRYAQSYFPINFENNNRKPICRMHLSGSKKYIGLFNEDKHEVKVELTSLDDIFLHSEHLTRTVIGYVNHKEDNSSAGGMVAVK